MKPYILIVNDGSDIVMELKELMTSMRPDWEYMILRRAVDAVRVIGEHDFNVVICDAKHKSKEGKSIQSLIKDKYPEVIRIIVTGERDKDILLQTSEYAHQLLAKPFNINSLIAKIEKTFFLRNYLKNEKLLRLVSGIEKLPSSPKVYLELERLLQSDDISINNVEAIISRDLTMTAKILQLVNSPFFGLANRVRNLMEAINLLGIKTIKTLTLYSEVFSSFDISESIPFSIDELWTHSIKTAKSSKEIMRLKSKDRRLHDDAYIAGLLHDIGKLVLCYIPDYYKDLKRLLIEKDIMYHEAEYEIIGATHAEVGAYLLSLWGLSEDIIEAVAFHHTPSMIKDMNFNVLSAVHIANAVGHILPHIDTKHLKYMDVSSNLVEYIDYAK